jgi:hypothetical protein
MFLTWKKGSGEWGTSNEKPCTFTHDSWGPFDNRISLKLKEYELRGLLTLGIELNDQVELVQTMNQMA